jgi:hypothetical protein
MRGEFGRVAADRDDVSIDNEEYLIRKQNYEPIL